jgi:hypothetical protein
MGVYIVGFLGGRGGPNGPFGPSRVCHALKNDPRQGSFLKNNLLQIHLIS